MAGDVLDRWLTCRGRGAGAMRLIRGVYVNMSPRVAAMVVKKVSSGLL